MQRWRLCHTIVSLISPSVRLCGAGRRLRLTVRRHGYVRPPSRLGRGTYTWTTTCLLSSAGWLNGMRLVRRFGQRSDERRRRALPKPPGRAPATSTVLSARPVALRWWRWRRRPVQTPQASRLPSSHLNRRNLRWRTGLPLTGRRRHVCQQRGTPCLRHQLCLLCYHGASTRAVVCCCPKCAPGLLRVLAVKLSYVSRAPTATRR